MERGASTKETHPTYSYSFLTLVSTLVPKLRLGTHDLEAPASGLLKVFPSSVV